MGPNLEDMINRLQADTSMVPVSTKNLALTVRTPMDTRDALPPKDGRGQGVQTYGVVVVTACRPSLVRIGALSTEAST